MGKGSAIAGFVLSIVGVVFGLLSGVTRRDQTGHDEASSLYGFRMAVILEPMR